MKIKVSDYIVRFLVSKNIKHVYGYPGGMITHFMDSLSKYETQISAHICYHEQGAAFAACGYAQTTGKPGVVYATSGPGVTNILTGVANAFFDSIPLIAIVGQVNTYEQKGYLQVRQKGFQEMEVCEIVKLITKYTNMISKSSEIPLELEKAYNIALEGRRGPVVLDIPMNIQREEIEIPDNYFDIMSNISYDYDESCCESAYERIKKELLLAKKPLIIAGNGINASNAVESFREMINMLEIPVVTSMISVSCIESENLNYYGFIGAYGHRTANFIVDKSDLIISLGSRLDCRQTGNYKNLFATNAKIIRVDIDNGELTNKIKDDEIQIICDVKGLLDKIVRTCELKEIFKTPKAWIEECKYIKSKLIDFDNEVGNKIIREISRFIPNDVIITTDVGQNQVWVSQSFLVKDNQKILFSGGHGAMGYSLPASIGAYYGSGKKIISINGDGGIQMNIQELQTIAENNLPIKIIVLNNSSLGMIRHFQEMYFDSNYMQTKKATGYGSPRFAKIAEAYGIESLEVDNIEDIDIIENFINSSRPSLIVINMPEDTYVYPKLAMGKPIYDQEPPISRELMNDLIMDKQ